MKIVEDESDKDLRFTGAWEILRTHEKFILETEKKYEGRRTAANGEKIPAKSIQSEVKLIDEYGMGNVDQSSGNSRDKKRSIGIKGAIDLKNIQGQNAKKLRMVR